MTSSHLIFVRIAPLLFVSIWSTGFIAAKYTMAGTDPFVLLCLRAALTVAVLVPILYCMNVPFPRSIWRHRHDLVTGVLLHCCYLGFVFWPIKNGAPAGIVAIIMGVQPLLTLALASIFMNESLSSRKIFGLVIGFIGVVTVISSKFNSGFSGALSWFNLSLCILGLVSIAIGVFYQKKFCQQSQLLTSTLMQYIAAIVATALFALLFRESWKIDWTPSFAIALVWQVFALSIGAILLLMKIIRLGEAGRASSMFYLVPPLVVIEAHFLFSEILSMAAILGMGFCIIGVYLANRMQPI